MTQSPNPVGLLTLYKTVFVGSDVTFSPSADPFTASGRAPVLLTPKLSTRNRDAVEFDSRQGRSCDAEVDTRSFLDQNANRTRGRKNRVVVNFLPTRVLVADAPLTHLRSP